MQFVQHQILSGFFDSELFAKNPAFGEAESVWKIDGDGVVIEICHVSADSDGLNDSGGLKRLHGEKFPLDLKVALAIVIAAIQNE